MTLDELEQWAHSADEISHQESRAFELLVSIARGYQEEIHELNKRVRELEAQRPDLEVPTPTQLWGDLNC